MGPGSRRFESCHPDSENKGFLRKNRRSEKIAMSQKKIPQKRVHRGKGQDYVRDPRTGRQILLGPTGTVESQQAYSAWIAEYVREVGAATAEASRPSGTLGGLVLRYLDDCSQIYRTITSVKNISHFFGCCPFCLLTYACPSHRIHP